jgi:hypothetical protein
MRSRKAPGKKKRWGSRYEGGGYHESERSAVLPSESRRNGVLVSWTARALRMAAGFGPAVPKVAPPAFGRISKVSARVSRMSSIPDWAREAVNRAVEG